MRCVSLVLLFIVATMASASEEKQKVQFDIANAQVLFQEFKTTHKKEYANPAEEEQRYKIFVDNLEKINKLNANSATANYGINKFADYTPEEMKSMHGFRKPN